MAMSERIAVIDGRRVRYRVRPAEDPPHLMTPAEVAAAFKVTPRTVARWADDGHLTAIRTPGGHRRYLRSPVMAALENLTGR